MAREEGGSAGIAIVCILVALGLVGQAHRDEARTPADHDELSVTKEVRLSDAAGLPDAVGALGGPVDKPPPLPGPDQALVVRVHWSGPDRGDGWYQLMVLDNRVEPARALPVLVGWNERGEPGNYWTGGYDALAARYEWLTGVTPTPDPSNDTTSRPRAVGTRATAEGGIGAVFLLDEQTPPFTDPDREVLVVLFYVDGSGQVRWAKNV